MTRLIASAFASLAILLAASAAPAATWLEDGERSSQDASNGSSAGWVNQRTGVVGTFTDAAPRSDESGRECREYSFTAEIAGNQQDIFGIACREPDGSWQEASVGFEPPREAPQEARPDNYPAPAYAPYPYAGWGGWYGYPSVGLSASYCFSGICLGGGYSTSHYSGYPYGYGYGYGNYGYRNYGYYGYRNYGYRNYGYRNYSYRNSGHRNHGYRNHSYRNHSYRNSGHRNHGYRNHGKRNGYRGHRRGSNHGSLRDSSSQSRNGKQNRKGQRSNGQRRR